MDLKEHFFTPKVFFALHSLLLSHGFPRVRSSTSKIAGFHADLRNIAPVQLFVWITTIHKRFICYRFYLTVRAGWPQNTNLHETFVLKKLHLWIFHFLGELNSLRNRSAFYKSLIITAKPQSLENCNKLFKSNAKQKDLLLS